MYRWYVNAYGEFRRGYYEPGLRGPLDGVWCLPAVEVWLNQQESTNG